jgi:hypothetical protein
VPKRHDSTIRKPLLKGKKIIKIILSKTTRIGPIICIEDPEEASGVDYVHVEKDTKVEETTVANIVTTTYPIRSDAISAINLDTS